MVSDQRGVTLLEVLISTVVLGIAVTGFLMALSTASTTTRIATEENQLVHLASIELERLRAADFEDVPFLQTSEAGGVQEVPNYFKDIAISQAFGGPVEVIASGDLAGATTDYSRDYAFDGKRANFNLRWMGSENALAHTGGGGPVTDGPGGGGPGGGGPGGGPITDGGFAPDDYQYVYCAFPGVTKISRILYDNRFNVTEVMVMEASEDDFDYLPHRNNIWQRGFEFFWSDRVLGTGEVFNPWNHEYNALVRVKDQGYGSSGLWVVFDDPSKPIEAGIVGVHNIDTFTDFDTAYHWPYVSEIEVYGFSEATNYVDEYRTEDGRVQYDNVIMYFPNYLGSGFDLGRRVYLEAAVEPEQVRRPEGTGVSLLASRQDLIKIVLEFYPSSNANRDETWQRLTWWQEDTNETARFQTTFYRDEPTRVDRLPNLGDLPAHKVYGDDENIYFTYTVPGAAQLRARFGTFDLGPEPGDTVTIEDIDGNAYPSPLGGTTMQNARTEWVPGDTIVIHFQSDGSGNTYDSGYGGFEVVEVEVKWVGIGGVAP